METTRSREELIKLAINGEKASFVLYSRAEVLASSEKVKKIFNRIARDELVHLFNLLGRFERAYPELCNEVDILMPTPDQAEVRKLATVEEFAQALEWAIQEEQKSLHVYLQLVRVVEDKDARMVLERIVRDETNHVRALSSLGEEEINEALVEERRFH